SSLSHFSSSVSLKARRSARVDIGLSALLASLTLGFVVCFAVAAAAYPGGTWCVPEASGFDPLYSYFCDVLREKGLNGQPNPGAGIARAALIVLAGAFVPFWLLLARVPVLPRGAAGALRVFGLLSAFGALGVALTPSDRFAVAHQLAVLTAGPTGVVAGGLAVIALARAGKSARLLAGLAGATVTFTAIDALLYAQQLVRPMPCPVALPVLQKLAAVGALAWMLAVAVQGFRRGRSRATSG